MLGLYLILFLVKAVQWQIYKVFDLKGAKNEGVGEALHTFFFFNVQKQFNIMIQGDD